MKSSLRYPILGSVLLATSLFIALSAESQPAAAPRMAREDAVLVTITASVESIDKTNREVTLKGPLGNSVTFTVDQRVKRLNEVQVGDLVRADYFVSFAAELRKPTPEEAKHPFVELDAAGEHEGQLLGVSDQDQATGASVKDVIEPVAQRRSRRHHLECLDEPGLLA